MLEKLTCKKKVLTQNMKQKFKGLDSLNTNMSLRIETGPRMKQLFQGYM